MKGNNYIISLCLPLLLFSCATLFTGTTDDIYINSNPNGASIYIGGLKVGKTPATITVKRPGFNDKEVVLKLEGYETKRFILKKSFNAVSILNLGSLLGWVIDFATGSIYKYDPKSYDIDLEKKDITPKRYDIGQLNIDSDGRYIVPNDEGIIDVIDPQTNIIMRFN